MSTINESLQNMLKGESEEISEKKVSVNPRMKSFLQEAIKNTNTRNCKTNLDKTIAYQRALQEAIEKVNPDKCWHEITNCDIYSTLLECHNDTDAVIERILVESKVQPKKSANTASKTKKSLNEGKSVVKKQGKKLTEAPNYELHPQYDSRQSFYGKARVNTGDTNDKNQLYSYDTLVAEIKNGKPVVYGTYSSTTLRHIKDWLKQNGFKAETSKQIMADYGVKDESCNGKKHWEKNLKEGWRGSDEIEMVWHGEWADPDLVYNGYTFNYWDIEDALWDMFLEETGHKDSESEDPVVEKEFNEYVRLNGPAYLDDVIAGGYFEDEKKTWHTNESLKRKVKKSFKESADCDSVESDLKNITKDFTKKNGTLTAWSEEQRDCARKLLRKHYKNVEVSDGRMTDDEEPSFVFSYSDPIAKDESLKEAKFTRFNNPNKRRFKKHYDRTDADILAAKQMIDDKKNGIENSIEYYDKISDKLSGKPSRNIYDKDECLKEDIGQDLSEYQKWVDYDMKKYGKVSANTSDKIKKAGLSLVKDQYGDYEVIADRKEESLKEDTAKQVEKEANSIRNRNKKIAKGVKESCKKRFSKKISEALKKSSGRKNLKEGAMQDGVDAFWDIVERAKLWIDDGAESIEDAIAGALDDGLIYTDDIVGLATKYGVIDDGELIDKFYEDLYSDVYSEVQDYWEDAHSEEENESLKKSDRKSNKKFVKESLKEDYIDDEFLSGDKVRYFNDYYEAKKYAERLGLKESEYGDVYGCSYCYWNESGDRNETERVVAYYDFVNGKPAKLSKQSAIRVKNNTDIDFTESLKEDISNDYEELGKLSKGLSIIKDGYGYGVSDDYVVDRFVVYNDGKVVFDDGRFKLSDKDLDKIKKLSVSGKIKKRTNNYGESLKEDTVKQGSQWVNKGEEGTHGKFKTKKEADAQRKAMFARGYKA